uniref:60S ribosomal protein n=1 Tax=Phaseolus vulgaris TaxID=3885 RepID=D2DW68_PHAVU|nr:60S ribosomal protein [Phaseolus vulgaris]
MGTQLGEDPFDVITLEKGKVGTFVFEDGGDEVYDVVGILGGRQKIVKGTQSARRIMLRKKEQCWTINLHKRLHGCTFKKMRKFAQKAMGTNDVKLNKLLRSVRRRIRVRNARKRNDDEDAKEPLSLLLKPASVMKSKFVF